MGKRSTADEPMYRVWRADEDEEEGGAREYAALTVHDAARLYADHCHRNRDGWEWSWPVVFYVRNSITNELFAVSVGREMVPEFVADKELSFERFEPAHHLLYGSHAVCEDPRLEGSRDRWPQGQSYIEMPLLVAIEDETQRRLAANAITCDRCRKRGLPLLARLVEARARRREREATESTDTNT